MKQKGIMSVKKVILAQLTSSVVLAAPAFAQNLPGVSASALASGNPTASPLVPPSSATTTGSSGNKVTQLQGIEVTGSLIRSSDKTGFNQVQTMTQNDIQYSGATTVSNFLRDTSANSASSWGEDTVLMNQAPGGAGIALRGMSMKYSLVLIDGQRAAPYAFGDGGTDTFFDINTVPINVIDRIEIVKTGAVSQYGSDAIAGVVNIITKKDFQGLQLDGSLGGAQHGGQGTTNLSLLGGVGDLNADRFNVTAALSFYRASGVTLAQRNITSNQDYSELSGGFFAQPSSFFMTDTGPQALNPCGPTGMVTSAANNLQTQTPGAVCSQNGAKAQSLAPQVEHTSAKVHADFKLSDYVVAFADLWGSYNTTSLASGLAGFGENALVPSFYDAGHGFTAFSPMVGGNALTYYFPSAQDWDTTSVFYRFSVGVKGSFGTKNLGDWDWSASYGHSQSEVSNSFTSQVNASTVLNYTNGVTPATFSAANLNDLPGVLGTSRDQGISKLDTLDATASTSNLFSMPDGDVGMGLGAQLQHQSEYIAPGSTEFVNPFTQAVNGQRNVAAAYYQVDIPLLSELTFSQSGRYDYYGDFGGVYSPRFALRYQPINALTLYASYDRGFRAPTLIELYQTASVTSQPVGARNVDEYFVGNPELKPEHTKNYNVGFQLSPTSSTDIGLDWYKIDVTKVIGQPSIVADVDAHPEQTIYYLGYENLAYLRTDGLEATFKQGLSTKRGTFTLSTDLAYVRHFNMPINGIAADLAGNNDANDTVFGGAFPRWKGNTSLTWADRDWTTTLTWQFTGPYAQVIVAGPNVASYSQLNLLVSYSGFKHWKLYAGINNLLDHAPPYDASWTYVNRGYFDPSLYSYIGRYFQVGATYKF
ncbi:TonB-dependent receptor [Dyella mobilis]|uniref:TonB-dependent receptor n=2 Tax=Dyella mobilis TaxID=1849582 RepID=A0ABS2KDQ9_9GAMM|nr:TonB-dependent receptor [Dyella mobilis]MBM7128980.1 TonB-dependent receptor [Dyella mobilis]